jgi:hypothetical protein
MKFTRFPKITARRVAAGLTVLAVSMITGAGPASAQNLGVGQRDGSNGRSGRLHIVKNCDTYSGTPESNTCHMVESNLPELPPGTIIYYNQPTGGPSAGAKGYVDSTMFVYVREGQWAVGRCTIANDDATPGLCTISDGEGPLAGFSARIVVTPAPGGNGYLYNWDGKYKFDSVPGR